VVVVVCGGGGIRNDCAGNRAIMSILRVLAWHTWHRKFSFDQNPVSSLFFLFQQRIGSVSFGVSRRVLVGR
jgi:hypothetical protein